MLHRWYARRGVDVQVHLCDYLGAVNGDRMEVDMADTNVKFSDEQRSIMRIALTHLEASQRRSIAKYAQTGRQAMVDALEKERAKIAGCLAALG